MKINNPNHKCNNKCDICGISERAVDEKYYIEGDDFIRIIDKEPSVDDDFFERIDRLNNLFPKKAIHFVTNGRSLYYKFFRDEINLRENLRFSVLFFGRDEKTHDKFTMVPGSFNQSLLGLKSLLNELSKGKEINIRIVLNESNFKESDKIILFFVERYKKVNNIEIEFWQESNDSFLYKKKLQFIQQRIFLVQDNIKNINIKFINIPFCFLNPFFWGNVVEENFKTKKYSRSCEKCKVKKYCPGFFDKKDLDLINADNRIYIDRLISRNTYSQLTKKKAIDYFAFYLNIKDILLSGGANSTKFSLSVLLYKIKDKSVASLNDINKIWLNKVKNYYNPLKEIFNIYIHLPYCRSRCTYCIYPSTSIFSKKSIDIYLKKIFNEIDSNREIFKNVKFNNFYFGGGTPSILENYQLEKILRKINSSYNFTHNAEKNFECNPESISEDKLKILKKNGISRISLGVQSFDKDVLKKANRSYQEYSKVKEVINMAKKIGLVVNTDIMIGLYGSSVEGVLLTLNMLMKLNPDSISVYPFMPSKKYLSTFYKIKEKSYYIFLKKQLDLFYKKSKLISKKNNFSHPDKIFLNERYSGSFKNKETYNKRKDSYWDPRKPSSVLGIGSFSQSKISGFIKYTNGFLIGDDFSEKRKKYSLVEYNNKDSMREYLFDRFSKKEPVFFSDFNEIFNAKLLEVFADAFEFLEKEKVIKIFKSKVEFSEISEECIFLYSLSFFGEKELFNFNLI